MGMTAGEELRQEGRTEQRLEITKRLLASGISKEAIAFATEISEYNLESIKVSVDIRREMAKKLVKLGIDPERVCRVTKVSNKYLKQFTA